MSAFCSWQWVLPKALAPASHSLEVRRFSAYFPIWETLTEFSTAKTDGAKPESTERVGWGGAEREIRDMEERENRQTRRIWIAIARKQELFDDDEFRDVFGDDEG